MRRVWFGLLVLVFAVGFMVWKGSAEEALPLPPLPAKVAAPAEGVEQKINRVLAAVRKEGFASYPERAQAADAVLRVLEVGLDWKALTDEKGRPILGPDGKQQIVVLGVDLAQPGK